MSFRLLVPLVLAVTVRAADGPGVLDYIPLSIDGKPAQLSAYRGKVLLIVNVASQSLFTAQYEGLEWLYQTYQGHGLVVLAFPSNDFGQEEPGADQEIRRFTVDKYKVTFPMFAKISLAGDHVAPLYQFLEDKQANPLTGGPVRWNFTKFLIGRDGKTIERFEPDVEPRAPELVNAIDKALSAAPAKE